MPDTMATLFSAGVTSVGCPARQRGLPAGREFIISCAPGWAGLESYLGKEKAGRNLFPARSAFSLLPWPWRACLPARTRSRASRSRVRLRDADVAADLVFANLVDDQFFGLMRAGGVEENRLIDSPVPLLIPLVFHGHGHAELVPLFIDGAKHDRYVGHLLRLVPAGDGEFHVVAFTQAAQRLDIFVVARNQGPELAARHLQVFTSGIEIRTDPANLGVHALDIIRAGFCREFTLHGCIKGGQLLGRLLIQLVRFFTRSLQLALRDFEPLGDNVQVTLQLGV